MTKTITHSDQVNGAKKTCMVWSGKFQILGYITYETEFYREVTPTLYYLLVEIRINKRLPQVKKIKNTHKEASNKVL